MAEVMLMPRMASVRLAAGVRKSPRMLLDAVTVVPAVMLMPLIAGDVVVSAALCERS